MTLSTVRSPDRSDTLSDWLSWLEYLHQKEIDLALERVAAVAERAGLLEGLPPIITVGGTNGKGSVVAMLTSIYGAAGYKTGTYTSPHLQHFNERIVVNGQNATDQTIVDSLAFVESYREEQSLTYFEYTTLAAMSVFKEQAVDVVILEVGLGGRLDAVNIWDASVSVLTSIAIDHESWLGTDRQTIGAEKVAIARANKPLIVAEPDPPDSVTRFAADLGASVMQVNQDYHYSVNADNWILKIVNNQLTLPQPALIGLHQYSNAAACVVAVDSLSSALPVSIDAIRAGLQAARLPGRFDRREYQGVEIIVDVAHNPSAAETLAAALTQFAPGRTIHAVIAMMADKDIAAVIDIISPHVTSWYCGQLDLARALPAAELAGEIALRCPNSEVGEYANVMDAFVAAIDRIGTTKDATEKRATAEEPIVLIFGSFFTVTEILSLWP